MDELTQSYLEVGAVVVTTLAFALFAARKKIWWLSVLSGLASFGTLLVGGGGLHVMSHFCCP